jgi:excisionase family DNA binding protein
VIGAFLCYFLSNYGIINVSYLSFTINKVVTRRVEMEKDMYTLSEISDKTGVTVRALRKYIHEGRIKAVKMGGNKFVVSHKNYIKFINGE